MLSRPTLAPWLAALFLLAIIPGPSRAAEDAAPEAAAGAATATTWRPALPGYAYRFPADHAAHPDHKTEWWYFTGSLRADNGREFGYELTWFRQGLTPPGTLAAERSRFIQSDFKFAHLAVTDLGAGQFHFAQRLARGGFGEAGFGPAPGTAADAEGGGGGERRLAWINGWELTPESGADDGNRTTWHLRAASRAGEPPMALDLRVRPRKPPVEHGLEGVSTKADGAGNASHYYSWTRLETSGTLSVDGKTFNVRGDSWFDHEWASNQLGPDQVGWDWFCFQFDDGTEAMLYAMRRRDGSVDPVSGGTFVDANGQATHLTRADFELTRTRSWKSTKTGAEYPLGWRVRLPGRGLEWEIKARLDDQELALPPVAYWEGAIAVRGTGPGGKPLTGHGYMELTGYAGALAGLSSAPASDGGEKPAGAGRGGAR